MISWQTVLVRLVLALFLGGLVGLDRERGERAAGIRTLALVALGSSLIIIVSAFGFADILGTPDVALDPSRIAAQVVSGIGFLGAGTILLRRKEVVKGLTTAAAIWVVAAIGLACGSGLLWEAVIATALTLLILVFSRPLHKLFRSKGTVHTLHIEAIPGEVSLLESVLLICRRPGVKIEHVKVQTGEYETLDIECRTLNNAQITQVVGAIRKLPTIKKVQFTLLQTDLENLDLSLAGASHVLETLDMRIDGEKPEGI